MNFVARYVAACLLMALASLGHAQPAPSSAQSAKEQRQATASKDNARSDRSQAEAKKLKSAQQEAKDRHGQRMKQADTELHMGVASGTGQMGAAGGAKKREKHDIHKDARKKLVKERLRAE